MASNEEPRRREVWLVALGADRAGKPGKSRPCVVVSVDELQSGGQADLIVVIPLSSSMAPSALRVAIPPGVGVGVDLASRAICRAIRAVDRSRFVRLLGSIDTVIMHEIESALGLILGLPGLPSRGPRR